MACFAYIIYSEKFDKYYIGQTDDVFTRLHRHNSGYEKFTSMYCPWRLEWHCEKATRAEAMKLEKKLKNLSKERLRQFIEKYR